jgi:ABC-type polysaccharide transport system permease subunit
MLMLDDSSLDVTEILPLYVYQISISTDSISMALMLIQCWHLLIVAQMSPRYYHNYISEMVKSAEASQR